MHLSLLVLALVFLYIALRQLSRNPWPIWLVVNLGALVVVLGGDLSLGEAWQAIDWDVMLFLAAVFTIGAALEQSGLLFVWAYRLLSGARSTSALVARLLLVAGLGSALLMNDTLAIIGAPLVLLLAREHRIDPQLLLLALAFAVTTGAVFSPVGNPQNLLIALHGGMPAPFLSFARALLLPTLISLGLTYAVLRYLYRSQFHPTPLVHRPVSLSDPKLARLAGISVGLLCALILLRVAMHLVQPESGPGLSSLALLAALPLLFAPKPVNLARGVDWRSLAFFLGLFVLMRAVWNTGWLQQQLASSGLDPTQLPGIFAAGVLGSQIISNVPLVALYLPLLISHGAHESAMLALAVASTLAGNLLLLGAASNIIIVQQAEQRGAHVGFLEFARVGIPLTLLQLTVFGLFLVV